MANSLTNYKEYIAKQFVGKTVRFKCDCLVPMDITGKVIEADTSRSEIIYIVSVDNGKRTVKIGENTPKLQFNILG